MRNRLGILVAVAVLAVAGGSSEAAATVAGSSSSLVTPAGFGAPVQVAAGSYRYISEVVDSTNRVHIAATGHGGLWYITDRSGTWSAHRILANPHNKSWFDPSIALDANDRVHIAAVRQSCKNCAPGGSDGIFYVTDKGRPRGTFPSIPTKLTPSASGDPSLKVSSGKIYLAYARFCSCIPGDATRLLLKTNVTGSWTVSQITAHGLSPSLRVGSDGHPRVAFGQAHGIGYAVAAAASGSFTSITIPGTTFRDREPLLALDTANRPHVAWARDNPSFSVDARYDWETGTGWHGAITVAPVAGTFAYDLDTLGRPNIGFGSTTVTNQVRFGGTWHSSTVTTGVHVHAVAVRRAFNGAVAIAYASGSTGIFVARN